MESKSQNIPSILGKFGEEIYEQIMREENPAIKIPQRGKSNVYFDDDEKVIQLGDKFSKRHFLNVAHTKKFMQTILVASYCRRLVEENKHAGIRELYYALKHTVEGSKENTFDDQIESNPIIEDLETALDILREELNLTADRRGYIYGDIVLKDGEDEFNASKLGRGGWAVPGTVEDIEFLNLNAEYILVIETAAMCDRLIEEKFAQNNNALLVACQGQAPRGIRRLINRLHIEKNLPVYVFTDGDPYGWYIYSTIKQGSMNLAYLSRRLGVPDAKFIGMTMDDIDDYGLQKVTEKLKDMDKKRIAEIMEYDWFKHKDWQEQMKKCLKLGVRIEQQALANKSLEFVAKEYLPQKIENEVFLP
ncbi:MAG: Type 2 DNA topoisomerase 6 subunit A [Candidatus Methanofastidiosum methylothiophilum]|jgi:DNA topoisomerase-6 subunit A|uniref:Type 2 DNA topoisomerase 6 subunit A n=1 Tax=Candidatus Methanofastidiosum methylothiophilum TaxID=1705564 RepID=A0A150J6C2_9EURY|nr:MAG: Type 2 DNA topoisomerase 6 subunit A [Candidatus Methanofastidiosum methylthiophilus]